jgi:hypothetical protein
MRNYAGSALMLFVTMAAAIGSYTVNLRVSGERSEVDRLRQRLVADARDIRNLQAELRTRARLPEMQRWNDSVLQMSAPAAGQFLRSPVQLASFGAAPAAPGAGPDVRYAVATPVPAAPMAAPVQRAAYRPAPAAAPVPAPDAARILKASYSATQRTPAPAPVAAAPIDLIAEIDAALPANSEAEQ